MLATSTDIIALDARVVLHAPGTPVEKLSKPAVRGYPHEYCEKFTLKNGMEAEIRPIRPDDETLMKEFEASLSEETVKQYMSEVVALEERTAHKRLIPICHADFDRQVPLIALVDGKIIGTARFAKIPLTPNARVVMQVADAYQKQGLGAYFMEKCLKIAAIEKTEKVFLKFFEENAAMTKLAAAAGFETEVKEGIVAAVKKM